MIKLKNILFEQSALMGRTINRNLINLLSPKIQERANKLLDTWEENGYVVQIKQTHRTWDQQTKYYKSGKSNNSGGDGMHEYGRAIDVLLIKGDHNYDPDLDSDGSTTSWDKKMRASNVPTTTMLGFAKGQGWEAFGLELNFDWFHIQYTDEFTSQKGGDDRFICKYGKNEISNLRHVPIETKQKYYNFIDNKESC